MALISINAAHCTNCNACTEICPNGIFVAENRHIRLRQERVHLCIACGQCMAACTGEAISVEGLSYEDDFFPLADPHPAPEAFFGLIESRRSVRAFKDKPVPGDLLEKVVEAISFAPPGFTPLNTELVVVREKKTIQEALPLMIGLYDKLLNGLKHPVAKHIIRRKIGVERMGLIRNHIEPMFAVKLPEMKKGREDAITRNAPAMILFHARKDADNHTTDINIALAFGLLAAHSLGLGATAIDLIPPAVNRVPALRSMFGIPDQNEVTASMILGYPKYRYRKGIRRMLKSVRWI